MADTPELLTLKANRDQSNWIELAARRGLLALLALVAILALLDVFGQLSHTDRAAGTAATLEVRAPTELRGGLFYQGRFRIRAERDVEKATLVLSKGWLEGMSVNTVEPAPVGEASRDGRLALDFGHVGAGDAITVYMQFQVNPTTVGRRSQDVELYDDAVLLASIDRTVTVFP